MRFEGCFVDEGVVEDEGDDAAGEEDGGDLEGDGEFVSARVERDADDGLFLGRVDGAGGADLVDGWIGHGGGWWREMEECWRVVDGVWC